MDLSRFHKKGGIVPKPGQTEDDFSENTFAYLWETQEEMREAIRKHNEEDLCIFTILDTGRGLGHVEEGVHWVNRLGYILTYRPVTLRTNACLV